MLFPKTESGVIFKHLKVHPCLLPQLPARCVFTGPLSYHEPPSHPQSLSTHRAWPPSPVTTTSIKPAPPTSLLIANVRCSPTACPTKPSSPAWNSLSSSSHTRLEETLTLRGASDREVLIGRTAQRSPARDRKTRQTQHRVLSRHPGEGASGKARGWGVGKAAAVTPSSFASPPLASVQTPPT